ncbi:MAG: hypothetical protein Q9226_002251 [Calogaya cf. arnoldii]
MAMGPSPLSQAARQPYRKAVQHVDPARLAFPPTSLFIFVTCFILVIIPPDEDSQINALASYLAGEKEQQTIGDDSGSSPDLDCSNGAKEEAGDNTQDSVMTQPEDTLTEGSIESQATVVVDSQETRTDEEQAVNDTQDSVMTQPEDTLTEETIESQATVVIDSQESRTDGGQAVNDTQDSVMTQPEDTLTEESIESQATEGVDSQETCTDSDEVEMSDSTEEGFNGDPSVCTACAKLNGRNAGVCAKLKKAAKRYNAYPSHKHKRTLEIAQKTLYTDDEPALQATSTGRERLGLERLITYLVFEQTVITSERLVQLRELGKKR